HCRTRRQGEKGRIAMNLLLDSIVRVSAVVVLALIVRALLRRRSAAVRHWVLSVAIACAAAMPLLAMMVPAWHIGQGTFSSQLPAAPSPAVVSTTTVVAQGPVSTDQTAAETTGADPTVTSAASIVAIARFIWMMGIGIGLAVLLAGLAHLKWLASGAQPIDGGRWARLADEISAAFELGRPVKLLQSDHPTLLV